MKKTFRFVLGALLIATGVLYALKSFDLIDVTVSFDGWWTLFIIVPSLENLLCSKDRLSGVFGVALGILLLLATRDVIAFGMAWKLIVVLIIVIFGISLIQKGARLGDSRQDNSEKEEMAAFCSKDTDYTGEKIAFSRLGAVFGGAKGNFKNAVIEDGARFDVFCAFGGIDLFLPDNVNVKTNVFCLFGGLEDKRNVKNSQDSNITLTVNGFCIFGGVDLK